MAENRFSNLIPDKTENRFANLIPAQTVPQLGQPIPQLSELQSRNNVLDRTLQLSGRDVAEGLGGVAGIVTNPVSFIANRISNLLGGPDIATEDLRGTISGLLNEAGLAQPETRGEQVVSNINQAVVGGGGFVGTGRAIAANAPKAIAAIGESLAAQPEIQGVSVATSAAAVESVPEDAGAGVKLAAGLIGALVPAVGAKAVSSILSRPKVVPSVDKGTTARVPDIEPPVPADKIVSGLKRGKTDEIVEAVLPDAKTIESAQRLGVDLNPEHYSTNSAFQDIARALKTQPGSKLQAAEVKALDDIAKVADDLVVEVGGSLDKAAVSDSVRVRITGTIDKLQKRASRAYEKVSNAIPAQTKVNTEPIKSFIKQKLDDFGGDVDSLAPVEKRLLQFINRKGKDGKPVNPTYAALDSFRKDVGDGFNKRTGPFADNSDRVLRQVYDKLSEAQNGVADALGFGNLYAGARRLVVIRKDVEDSAVELFGKDLSNSLVPKISAATTALSKGDISKINKLMASLPKNRRAEVAATILSDIFSGGSRRGGALGGGFVSTFESLNRNQSAKNILFRQLPNFARKRFDDIGRVFSGIIKSNRKPLGNPSGTAGGILKAFEDGSAATKIFDVGKKIAVSEGLSSSIGLPGAGTTGVLVSIFNRTKTTATEAADNLLSSNAFTRAINESLSGSLEKADKIVQNSPQFKAWIKTVDEQTATDITRIGFVAWLAGNNTGQDSEL